MPSVPRRDPATVVKQAPLPNAQFTTGGVTEETFGGGASGKDVGTALEALGTQGIKLAIKEQKDADDIVAQGLLNEAAIAESDIKTKISKLQGEDSARGVDIAKEEFKALGEKLNSKASNPYIKGRINKELFPRYLSAYNYAQSHGVQQMMIKDKKDTEAGLAIANKRAVDGRHDPDTVASSILNMGSILRGSGQRLGASEEQIEAEITQKVGGTKANIINTFLAEGDMASAQSYFKQWKNDLGNSEAANRIRININQEEKLQGAQLKADKLMLIDDPAKVLRAIADISDKQERTAVQEAYNTNIKERTAVYNNNEADIAMRMAKGEIKKAVQLEQYQGTVSDRFMNASAATMDIPFFRSGGKTERIAKGDKLYERYYNIIDDDIYEKQKKYASLRVDIVAQKGYLKEDQWKELLAWIDPSYIQKFVPDGKKSFMKAGMDSFKTAVKQMTIPYSTAYDIASISQSLLRKMHDPSVKEAEIPVLVREAIGQTSYLNNPENMEIEKPANYTINEGNLSMSFPAESEAKADITVDNDYVRVKIKSTGEIGTIPRKNFNAKWMEEA